MTVASGTGVTGTGFDEAFTELFGFSEQHATYGEAQAASERPTSFRRGMADFWRYKASVGNAFFEGANLDMFQHDGLFHFCTARTFGSDEQELAQARKRDPALTQRLLAIGDSPIGYAPGVLPHGTHTVLHTRHVAQLAFLLTNLRRHGDPAAMHYLEVGGGFGNFVRLLGRHCGFASWTICDLPFMTRLQRWYLARTLPGHAHLVGEYGPADPGAIRFVANGQLNEFADASSGADVLVSAHAWSELSRDDWLWYLHNLLPKVRFLLYAASAETPSCQEANWRLERLLREMRLVDMFKTQEDSCIVAFFERRA